MKAATFSAGSRCWISALLAVLFGANERRCVVCGRIHVCRADGLPACSGCLSLLPQRLGGFCPACGELYADESLPPTLCGRCLKEPPPWQSLTFHGEYAGTLRDLILRCKFRQDPTAARLLAGLLAGRLAPALASWPDPARKGALIIPMPLHPKRLAQRGGNQCMELARALRLPPIHPPTDGHGLSRIWATPQQRGLSRRERLRNVLHAFEAGPTVAGRHILLLDDVLTTGTTMGQAVRCLLAAGAAQVHCAVVARVKLRGRA